MLLQLVDTILIGKTKLVLVQTAYLSGIRTKSEITNLCYYVSDNKNYHECSRVDVYRKKCLSYNFHAKFKNCFKDY